MEKYSDLEKIADQLITCEIGSTEQCDNWLKMFYWYHDEMKKLVMADYNKFQTVKMLFWVEWFDSNASNYHKSLSLSFGFNLRTFADHADLSNSEFRRLEPKADDYLAQYLLASALDYFVKQNFVDKQGTVEHSNVDYTILTNYPFEIKFNIDLLDNTFYRKIIEYIIEPHVFTCSIDEMLQNLKNQIIFKNTATEFDAIAQNFEEKSKILTLHK